jgi:nitrite reductase (NADH) large subunit
MSSQSYIDQPTIRREYLWVYLSQFFAGRPAIDLRLVEPGFFERTGYTLRNASRALAKGPGPG